MFRTLAASVLVVMAFSVSAVRAEEPKPSAESIAPSPAFAAAWARESVPSSPVMKSLFVSYGVLQGLDMASTIVARNRGAIEANPMMGGGFARGIALKAAAGAVTMLAIRSVAKKNRKAAIITMIAANVGTAAVFAHNMRVAHLQK